MREEHSCVLWMVLMRSLNFVYVFCACRLHVLCSFIGSFSACLACMYISVVRTHSNRLYAGERLLKYHSQPLLKPHGELQYNMGPSLTTSKLSMYMHLKGNMGSSPRLWRNTLDHSQGFPIAKIPPLCCQRLFSNIFLFMYGNSSNSIKEHKFGPVRKISHETFRELVTGLPKRKTHCISLFKILLVNIVAYFLR